MSTNQAFIKAFRRDHAGVAPPKPTAAPRVPARDTVAASATPRQAAVSNQAALSRQAAQSSLAQQSSAIIAEHALASSMPSAWSPAAPQSSAAWQSSVEIVAPAIAWPHGTAADVLADTELLPTTVPTGVATTGSLPRPGTMSTPGSSAPAIGKRPLSSFAPVPALEPEPMLEPLTALEPLDDLDQPLLLPEPAFVPETSISAFHWPQVCRSLWERYADDYERIAEILLARADREPGRGALVGVTSLHAGDGASTNMLCLAVALAARKQSVILVDGNFRAPRLAALLGAQPTTSWQDVLELGLPVAEAVIRAEHDGVDLLPLDLRDPAAREPNGAKLAAGLQTTITAGVLRYAYDMVLVDLGAILAPRSFATISNLIRTMRIEMAVAVTDPKHAEENDLAVAGELLDETGCELLGMIENRSAAAQ